MASDIIQVMIVFRLWHNLLDMEHKNEQWHKDDIADELGELNDAHGLIHRWSEYSDVVYTLTRSRWGGFTIESPLTNGQFIYGALYMFPKYTLRWLFFRRAGKKAGGKRTMHEVRNPQKVEKLAHIASKHGIPPQKFVTICQRQLRYWPLLK